jgi:hypothetical protein
MSNAKEHYSCILILGVVAIGNRYIRFMIFTMEVAVAAMPPGVDQWVLILDVGGKLSRTSGFMFVLLTCLRRGLLVVLKLVA